MFACVNVGLQAVLACLLQIYKEQLQSFVVILPPLQTGQFYNEAYVLERADVILKEHNEKQHSKKLPQRQLMPKINVVDSKSPNK
jgi:hypothetical protein